MTATTNPPRPLLIGDVFRSNASVVPGRVAAALGERTLTHRELDRAANRTARALRALGVAHGDRVVTWADTSLDLVPLFAACAKLGAVFAPVNARLGAREAAEVARIARPRVVVVDAERAQDSARLADGCGAKLAQLGPGLGADVSHAALPEDDSDVSEPALREDEAHVIFFTSGSTGRPKGVVLSHRVSWLRSFQGVFRDEPRRTVCMFPMFHMAPWTLALAAWQTRGEIAFVASPTPDALLGAIERRRANHFYGIPLIWTRILERDLSRFDLSSLRELDTGTSAVPIELVRALRARFPACTLRIYYGATETGTASALSHADVLRKPGSVGAAPPGGELRIAEDGELLVRSAFLLSEYFEDAEATRAALRDGWFHTGDLCALDTEGYLSIVGRKKDVIRSGGESVSPAEVEAALRDAPGIEELAVVGIPDAQWGEVVCAVVVPKPGAALTLDALRAHCAGTLAGYKRPRRLELVRELPRTEATRQVQRALLVERIANGVRS
ncbi:MAG: acyl--CoA ligase [Deltaproteobacteria bacterium]|nr:acyl--CoA ligase [Deltaproteobacteria bacterium]